MAGKTPKSNRYSKLIQKTCFATGNVAINLLNISLTKYFYINILRNIIFILHICTITKFHIIIIYSLSWNLLRKIPGFFFFFVIKLQKSLFHSCN